MAFRLVGNGGPRKWSCVRDDQGYREYQLTWRVTSDDPGDGPALAQLTPGLPLPGTPWIIDNDLDLWAWCRAGMQVVPVAEEGEPNNYFDITQNFSNKPLSTADGGDHDPTQNPEDPLMQPAKVSGGFTKGKVEATHNFNGVPILTSSYEQIRGPQVEFDANNPTIRIEQNVALLNLPLLCLMVDTVNYLPLWGLPPRTIKLSNVTWERKFGGIGSKYYTRTLEFDINFRTHDKMLLDEGKKALHGKFMEPAGNYVLTNIAGAPPNPLNPHHYSQFKDRNGENCNVILNGAGLPSSVMVGLPLAAKSYVVGDSVTVGAGSTVYVAIVNNINVNPVTNSALPTFAQWKWVAKVGGDDFYDSANNYVVGNITDNAGEYYICVSDSPAGTPFDTNSWLALPDGVNAQGVWQGSAQPTPSGGAGSVYVAYYPGANMLLLGIPLSF